MGRVREIHVGEMSGKDGRGSRGRRNEEGSEVGSGGIVSAGSS